MAVNVKNVCFARPAVVLLVLLLLPAFRAAGQTGFSYGAGFEANIITIEDNNFALGGLFGVDYRFGPVFAAGFRVGAFYDLNRLMSLENRLFVRWYFVHAGVTEFFFQGDGCLLLTFRDPTPNESRGAPGGGLTLGARINLPRRWYLEPFVRGGYPFIACAGLMVGFSPQPKAAPAPVEPAGTLQKGEELVVFRPLESVPEITALSVDPTIYFTSNLASFRGLDPLTIENNYRILRGIAAFLQANPEYNLIIEGHANPVTKSQDEEEKSLNPLSLDRAGMVANLLMTFGVERRRLIVAGSGGTKALIPWGDRINWNLNRRVQFILIRQNG